MVKQREPLDGASLLALVVDDKGCNAVGKEVGCAGGNVSRWRRGVTTPGAVHRLKLLRLYGIPFDSWPEPVKAEEQVKRTKTKRRAA